MSKKLAQALRRESAAEDNVSLVLKREYPVGADVSWRKGGLHCGEVISHGYGDRIKVRNHSTGNGRWIYACDIVSAMGAR